MNGTEPKLNDCGCCEGVAAQTPALIANPPGLTALAYRVGTHSRFQQSMQAGLASAGKLRALKTRRDDDPTIGLLDAWATVLDVLTFYQERIANEGYLRTATDRRSLLELGRAIGYELRPGVAAGTYLAFTMETAPGAPRQVTIAAGAKAQSVPEQGEQAQTFETVEEIVARPEWNKLRPRTTQPQSFVIEDQKLLYAAKKSEVRSLFFKGTSTGLAPGDLLLVTTGAGATKALAKRVLRVQPDDEWKRTEVEIEPGGADSDSLPEVNPPADPVAPTFSPNAPPLPFTALNIQAQVLSQSLRERDLQTLLQLNGWNGDDLMQFVAKRRVTTAVPGQATFAFRERVGFFGHNAPAYASLRDKDNNALFHPNWEEQEIWKEYKYQAKPALLFLMAVTGLVETPPPVTLAVVASLSKFPGPYARADVYLERVLTGLRQPGWAVFEVPGLRHAYRVEEVHESSLIGFGMSGRATGLKVSNSKGTPPDKKGEFLVRRTTAHVKSEELELAALPLADLIAKDTEALTLDQMVLGLQPGQRVVLSGEQESAPGVTRQELLELQEIIHHDGLTTLLFREQSAGKGLRYSYLRPTVTLNANVARATHGETKREVLGSGDAAAAFQKFLLKQSPLTYVSAPTPTGLASTLQLRVNDILWNESPGLYRVSPLARTFIRRRSDEGKTTVQFGDGVTGARLPSGVENVTATYRVGLGLGGLVKAGQINLLLTRPLGVKEVVNPLPATGAADPETRDQARENVPFTVLTLDRIVSLQDFENYARAYPGIGQAQAVWLWDGESKVIHLTLAGADGGPVSTTSDLYRNLQLSIQAARDPGSRVRIDSFAPLAFNVRAKLLMTRGHLPDKVKAAVVTAVRSTFAFGRRAFGQAVTKSEVLAVIQGVEGVAAVDLDTLHFSSNVAALAGRLPARTAGWNAAHNAIQAAELLLVNPGEIQLTEMPA